MRRTDVAPVPAEADRERDVDGIGYFLRVIHRAAFDPAASYWCTPGHNRGKALAMSEVMVDKSVRVPVRLVS
jgi:hypothetical protein